MIENNNETIKKAYEIKESKKWLNAQLKRECMCCLHLLDDTDEICKTCDYSNNVQYLINMCDCELLKICADCCIVAEEENDACKICPCKSAWGVDEQ